MVQPPSHNMNVSATWGEGRADKGALELVGGGIYKITLREESEWGWGRKKWREGERGRGWGAKGVTGERERAREGTSSY